MGLTIRPPRSDDRRVSDIVFGIIGSPAILVAHDLNLYAVLAEAPRTRESPAPWGSRRARPRRCSR